jgi:hypothetical protein
MMTTLPHELTELRAFAARLQREISARDLRSGRWYEKLLTAYVGYYAQRPERADLRDLPLPQRAARAQKLIERTALWTALAGTGAAAGVTAASIATVESAGLALPAVLPALGVGLVGELLLRAILHLQLACELAELYDMPFRPGGETELIRLYALATRAEMHQTEDDPGRGLVERVVRMQEAGGLGKLIAAGLVGESLLRNAIPFADVVVSSVRNWQLSFQIGRFVQGYAARRVALDRAVEALKQQSPAGVEVLLEGLWFIFISDGRLTGIETALLAHLMRQEATSAELTEQFVSDEAAWLERLSELDPAPETRTRFLRALEVAAALEKPVTPAELTILKRAAQTLGVELAVERTAEDLQRTAASSAFAFEHEQRQTERAQAALRSAADWATRKVHSLRARPHEVSIHVEPHPA